MPLIARLLVLTCSLCWFESYRALAQGCCSGGGTNPLAGGNASGVLAKGQLEFALSNSYSKSDKFFEGSRKADPLFDNIQSDYWFFRSDYGVSEKLTLSGSVGYYGFRTITEHSNSTEKSYSKRSSRGMGDLILLPRYKIYSNNHNSRTTELDVGLGFKIPIGSHIDSTFIGQSYFINKPSGGTPFLDSTEIWQTSPPLIQTTTGSNDIYAYLFFMRQLPHIDLFAGSTYIRRGWNSLGIKFGDFVSTSLFFNKRIASTWNAMLQLRVEWMAQMQANSNIDYLATYNIDRTSTGSRTLYVSPQAGFNSRILRYFILADIPVYQHVRGLQSGLPAQITCGASFRFFPNNADSNCETLASDSSILPKTLFKTIVPVKGNCEMCKKTIESVSTQCTGVASANWNEVSKTLILIHNGDLKLEQLQRQLAKAGYDSTGFKASDKAYEQLHTCCKYPR